MKYLIILLILSIQFAYAGTYTRFNRWDKNELKVCFAKPLDYPFHISVYEYQTAVWDEKDKANVQKWIDEEYTSERTGVYFTGWQDCENLPEADVVLYYDKDSRIKKYLFGGVYGEAFGLGSSKGKVPNYPLASNGIVLQKSGLRKGVAVHEFGHVSGLVHEHNHPDASLNGKACPSIKPINSVIYGYTPYDVDSVMSYCRDYKVQEGLSDGDVKLLKSLFKI